MPNILTVQFNVVEAMGLKSVPTKIWDAILPKRPNIGDQIHKCVGAFDVLNFESFYYNYLMAHTRDPASLIINGADSLGKHKELGDERPKKGVGVPLEYWLRTGLKEWASDLLEDSKIRQQGFFHPDMIKNLWEQHQCGSRNWTYLLWNILMFQAWYEKNC